jgi:hypothetical protein
LNGSAIKVRDRVETIESYGVLWGHEVTSFLFLLGETEPLLILKYCCMGWQGIAKALPEHIQEKRLQKLIEST